MVCVGLLGCGQIIVTQVESLSSTNTSVRQSLRFFGLWRVIGIGLVLFVVFQSLTPAPLEVGRFEYHDKVGHFVSYFVLMSWFAQLYQRQRHLRLLLLFVAMGIIIEILQGQTSYRLFEFSDIFANGLGSFVAWALASTAYATLLLRAEKNLFVSASDRQL